MKKTYFNSIEYKYKINKILNESINNKVKHLIFPELSIPPAWMNDIIFYCKRHKIQVTFGLQYLFENVEGNEQIYNPVVSIYPFDYIKPYVSLAYVSLREKRYYPYAEKAFFDANNFIYSDSPNGLSEVVQIGRSRFSNFLCYELTSLTDRAKLVDKVDVLFVPVLNKDTNYFSSIVDSTAREVYCYVCMANTSIYGDSRITGPFGTNEKDIVRLKGGDNIFCVIGEVSLDSLTNGRETTDQKLLDKIKLELTEKNEKRKYKPLSAGFKVH